MKSDHLKIIGIDIRDVKRVQAFTCSIDPSVGLVTIGGENAQGKSSVLDAIESCLGSPNQEMKDPVRKGSGRGYSRITIGGNEIEYYFERVFEDGKAPRLAVKTRDGSPVANAAAFIKGLLNEMPIDPIGFLDAAPKDQRATLLSLTDIDIDGFDSAIREALDEEKRLEREKVAAEGRVRGLQWHDDAPKEMLVVSSIAAEIAEADKHNAAMHGLEYEVKRIQDARGVIAESVARAHRDIARLQQELEAAKESLAASVLAQNENDNALTQATEALESFVPIDKGPLEARLVSAEELNEKFRSNALMSQAKDDWVAAEEAFTAQIEKRKTAEAAKRKALAEAKFPVDGLGFDESQVTYNGLPLRQASQAERYRCAVGISLAKKGRLAPILIRDASVMDRTSLALLDSIAKEHGAQIIAEIVANRTEDGFDRDCILYIEDGTRVVPGE